MLLNIQKAVCLTLDKRIREFERIQNEWRLLGIDVEMFLCGNGELEQNYNYIDVSELPPRYKESINYSTWYNRPNAYNCWKCHKMIFKDFVKNFQDGYLLLLEDDSQIEPDFLEILEKILPFLRQNSYEILNFGPFHYEKSYEHIHSNLLRLRGSGGLHGCLLSHRLCQILVNMIPLGPFDWMIGQWIHPLFNCYGTYPAIVTQLDNNFSFIENSILKKPDRWHL